MQTLPIDRGRLPLIDSIRALALLGVIIMNFSAMQMRFVGRDLMGSAGPLDIGAMIFDLLFVQGKARACFAFLFGFGFSILMVRSEEKGTDFGRIYVRRMLVLLAFGLINQAFLFWGDILVLYALLGLVLLPLRRLTDEMQLRLGMLLVLLPPLVIGGLEAAIGGQLPSLVAVDSSSETARGFAAMTSSNYLDFVRFNFSQAVERRLTDTSHMIIYDLAVFGLFLLGSWAARQRIVFELGAWRPGLRKIMLVCLPLGLALSIVTSSRLAGFTAEGALYGAVTAAAVGLPIMALGYLAAATLWFDKGFKSIQRLLAPAGRMPLTNYIASGVIGCFFFYGYGLGMLGKLGLAATNLFAIGIFVALVAFSHLWLARNSQGPLEWAWRKLTYGRLFQPSTKVATASN
jgi:uncharacterized protein